jgi:hypothetical protein
MMTWADFGLTPERVKAALNGSEADRAAIFDHVISSGRLDEYLEYLQQTKPLSHRVIAPYLRHRRDQQRGLASSH